MPRFYVERKDGWNFEKWDERPDGALTVEEYMAKFPPVAPERPTLEEAKVENLRKVIEETEGAILAGFDYIVDGQILHFSYQYNDQQNFSDTANMATFGKMGVPGVPETVTWNGWLIEKDTEGKEVDRSLVLVTLSNDEFLALYMQGALAHKAKQMTIGSERKGKVEAATTIEELEAI